MFGSEKYYELFTVQFTLTVFDRDPIDERIRLKAPMQADFLSGNLAQLDQFADARPGNVKQDGSPADSENFI
jgi:hypothetical protein